MLRRDGIGRIVGELDDYFLNSKENDHWVDKKEWDVRFPKHNETEASPVIITYIKNK